LVICVLYFATCWNILSTLLCSSSSAFSPCTNLGVWNLRIYPLELIYEKPRLLCEVQIFPKMFVLVAELSLKKNIPSLFYGIGVDYYTFDKSGSSSYICSFMPYWVWDCDSLLGHLLCSYPFDLFSSF
jgi:hypothetical protein